MNKLKIVLLYQFLAVSFSYGMEQEIELPAQTLTAAPQQSRIPSLKHLVLSKIGSLLLKQDKHVSISALDQAYPGAQADCARILAEDERVALWNKFGTEQKTVDLDHCALIANGFADEVKENTVYAATFTANDQFLLTLSCKKDVQANYVLNVWRVSDFSSRLAAQHAADACQKDAEDETSVDGIVQNTVAAAAETIKAVDTAPLVVKPVNAETLNDEALNQEMLEQPEPVKPCSEFVIRPMNYCIAHMFNVICDPTSSLVVLTLPYGDCYFLNLSPDGVLSRLYRLNILPLAKELQTIEGAEEENQLYRDNTRLYVKLLAFNTAGNKLLMHIERNPSPETAEKRRGGALYCFPIEQPTRLFAATPAINILDETYKIADDVEAAVWSQDGTISFIDIHNYKILRTVNTAGEEIGALELLFDGIQKNPLRPAKLILRKYTNDLLITSDYCGNNIAASEIFRIDRCNLLNGSCMRLHDMKKTDDQIDFIGNECTASTIHTEFLPDERFALKIFEDYGKFYIILWDILLNCSAEIIQMQSSYFNYTYALSTQGSFIFIADHPQQNTPCKFSAVISLLPSIPKDMSPQNIIELCKTK